MEFYVTKTETVYPERGDVEVHLWGRNTDGEAVGPVVVEGFEPYFYVPESEQHRLKPREYSDLKRIEESERPSLFGDDVAKVVATHPGGVPGLKEQYDKTFEADVVFTNRFRVDTNVYTGVEVPSNRCSPEDIEPVEITEAPVRYCYFDIEINDDGGFPVDDGTVQHTDSEVFSIVAYDSFEEKYHGFVYLPGEPELSMPGVMESGEPPGKLDKLHYRLNEKAMLKDFFNWVSERSPDVLLAWNIGFDAAYLVARASKVGADPAIMARGHEPEAYHNDRRSETTITGRVVYDLMEAWEAMQYSEVSSSLDNAASMELAGEQKIEHEESITEMWEDDTAGLMAYNAKDVELMVRINDAAGVMQDRKELKEAVGADFEYTIEANDFIEMLVRRKVDEWGVVAPTKTPPSSDDDGFEGAYTFPAFKGIRKNVVSIDLASLYPFTMWMLNASPETYIGQQGEITVENADAAWAPNGATFSKEQDGLFKELVDEALELTQQAGRRRDQYAPDTEEWEYWNQTREARKRIRNALYGVLGWVWFFLYDKATAESVTTMAQEVIKTSADHINEETDGEVVYGDTDSCYIAWPDEWDTERALNATHDVVETLNNSVYPELAAEYGMGDVECKWEIEMEDASQRMFQAGKKKRYAKKVVWKEGMDFSETLDEPSTKIVGFEYKRSDVAGVTKEVQKQVLNHIVEGDDDEAIREAVFEGAKQIKRRGADLDLIGIPGGIGQPLNEFDSETAQVKGAKTANELLDTEIGEGDKPKRIYLERKALSNSGAVENSEVICFNDSMELAPIEDQIYVDVNRMKDVTLRKPMERILDPVGVDVDAAMNGRVQKGISDWV